MIYTLFEHNFNVWVLYHYLFLLSITFGYINKFVKNCLFCICKFNFHLCACGGDNKQTESTPSDANILNKSTKDAYVGTWETEQLRLMITKGGIGRWGFLVDDDEFVGASMPINWEVKDEIMVVTISVAGFEYNAAFELNDSGNILNEIQKSGAFSGDVENDTEYVKVP